jgi:hypothetical protein
MDPLTAFVAAQTAVGTIKKAVALGKDISGLIGEFSNFFDAKDVIQKAVNDNGKKGQSDTGRALELVMQAEQLRQAEEELKNLLIYGYGQSGLWEQLLLERSKIRQAREKNERDMEQKRRLVSKQRVDWAVGITTVLTLACTAVAFIWFVVAVVMA